MKVKYTDLTADERYLLSAMTMVNDYAQDHIYTKICKEVLTASQVSQCVNSLKNKGCYDNQYFQVGIENVNLHDVALASYDLYVVHPEWAQGVKRCLRRYGISASQITKLYEIFFQGDAMEMDAAIEKTYAASFFFKTLVDVLEHPKFQYFISKMSSGFHARLFDAVLDEVVSGRAAVSWEKLKQMSEVQDKVEHPMGIGGTARKLELYKYTPQERFAYYYFFACGELSIDLKEAHLNPYTLVLAAVQQLLGGNYAAAYKFFTKAMTVQNKCAASSYRFSKGLFNDDLANYCFALCNILVGTPAALHKNETLQTRLEREHHRQMATILRILNSLFVTHKDIIYPAKAYNDEEMGDIRYPEPVDWLLALVLNKIGKLTGKHKPEWWGSVVPDHAFLCHELMGDETYHAAGLPITTALPGDSLFLSLDIKEPWRTNLEQLIASLDANTADDSLEQRQKLLYLISWDSLRPIVRKRMKNGRWSSGRELQVSDFVNLEGVPDVDGYDTKLRNAIDPFNYRISLEKALPLLIGCKRVFFVDENYNELPVNIHEERAYLNIDKEKRGGFKITANWKGAGTTVVQNTDTDYAIITPTVQERKIFDALSKIHSYPAKAEPLITQLIEQAGAQIGLRTNMKVEMENLDKVVGRALLSLQVIPTEDDAFLMTVVCHPLPSMTVTPGQGNLSSVEDFDGKKVVLERDIKAEKKNLRTFADELVELEVWEADDDPEDKDTLSNIRFSVRNFLDFLEWSKDNGAVCEIEWKKGAKITVHPPVKGGSVSINIKSKNGWFEMEGDVQIDEQQVISLQKLLLLMRESKGKYIKLNDHEYLQLTGKLKKLLRKVDNVAVENRSHLQMAPAAVALLGDVLDSDELQVNTCQALVDLEKRIKTSERRRPRVPKMLNAELRGYQQEGFEWMSKFTDWGAGVCLADDMGLGKTVQTITLLLEQQAEGPSLIVAPASVVPNWRNELAKFAPTLLVSILNDSLDRKATIERAKAGDVVLSTYAMLNIEQESLTAKEWNVVCLDEAHTIKNANTKMSKAAMRLQAKRKVMLTGTPLQNHLSELWNLFQFIDPGLLGSLENFKKKYIIPIEEDHDKEQQAQLRKLIAPFLLRRTKAEVVEELPEKHDIYMPVSLSPEEMALYEARRQKTEKALNNVTKVDVSVLAELTKLREMACSCSLVDKRWKKESSKVQTFIELAEELLDGGNRALVFSQFTSFFDEVRKAMDKAKIPYLYLDGSTPMKKREKLVSDFQSGACPFFLISLKAGGLGLNLTGANYVIHLDPWWNPAIEEQATDRAYRIGQNQNVTVYHLISEHTIEEKILRLHKSKRDLADSLLEGMDVSHSMTKEELLKLLMK
ncbi:MAG: DEAD/DEAH box helicase [Prevotella sp.]|nr:DEAD/DEAH box helicase [Prevotella sp.]